MDSEAGDREPRVRGRIETVLSAAKARKLRTGENVAAWDDNLSLLLAPKGKVTTVRHHPALPWQQMPGLMDTLAVKSGQAAKALRLLILSPPRDPGKFAAQPGAKWIWGRKFGRSQQPA